MACDADPIDVIGSFHRVSPGDGLTWRPYIEAYAMTRRFPRFYMSTVAVAGETQHYWGVVNDCLVIAKKRVFYRVQGGDTLERIARAFAVAHSEILAWNALDPSARLVSGMVLTLWVPPRADLSSVRVLDERDVKVLVAGTPDFFDHFEGLNGKKRITVEAKNGDTLASLGRRYGMSVGWMERINRRSRQKKLEPGDKLVVYVAAGVASAKAAAVPAPAPDPAELPAPPDAPPAAAPGVEPAEPGPAVEG